MDADLGQERGQADNQVLLAVDDRPLAEDVLVGVHIGIDKPAALLLVLRRNRLPAERLQHFEEAVRLDNPHRHRQFIAPHAETLLEQSPRGPLGIPRGAELDRGRRGAHRPDHRDRRPSRGNLLVLVPDRSVQSRGIVGQEDRRQPEIAKDRFQIAKIGRRDDPGQDVDGLVLWATFGHLVDQRAHRGMKALGVRPGITRRGNVDDLGQVRLLLANLAEEKGHVIADRFGQAGRRDAHQLRRILPDDVLQPEAEIVLASEDRRNSPKFDEAMSSGSLKWLIM